MNKIDLCGQWKMKNVQDIDWLVAEVPGTVFTDLRNAGLVEDPYCGDIITRKGQIQAKRSPFLQV